MGNAQWDLNTITGIRTFSWTHVGQYLAMAQSKPPQKETRLAAVAGFCGYRCGSAAIKTASPWSAREPRKDGVLIKTFLKFVVVGKAFSSPTCRLVPEGLTYIIHLIGMSIIEEA
jgi:hypothetical protein